MCGLQAAVFGLMLAGCDHVMGGESSSRPTSRSILRASPWHRTTWARSRSSHASLRNRGSLASSTWSLGSALISTWAATLMRGRRSAGTRLDRAANGGGTEGRRASARGRGASSAQSLSVEQRQRTRQTNVRRKGVPPGRHREMTTARCNTDEIGNRVVVIASCRFRTSFCWPKRCASAVRSRAPLGASVSHPPWKGTAPSALQASRPASVRDARGS